MPVAHGEHGATVLAAGRTRFGPASEEPYRRRTTDGLRLVAAALGVTFLATRVGGTSLEQQVLARVGLPPHLVVFAHALEGVSGLWAAGLVTAAAVGARRWRLARDLVIAGFLAWVLARGVGLAVGGELRHHYGALLRGTATPEFPTVQVAVVVAVLRAAAPYVGGPVRRTSATVVVLLLAAELYLGSALLRDQLAGVLVGWGSAAAVHLALGSPGGRPTAEQVRAGLADLGVHARSVRLAPEQPRSGTLMLAEDEQGPLQLTVLGRDDTDARLLSRVWHLLLYRDAGPRVFLSRAHEVEHQAYALLLAADRGAPVPAVAGAGVGGPAAAVLAQRVPAGTPLADLDPVAVDDRLLGRLWHSVAALHTGPLAHGRLTTHRVLVTASGTVLTGFDHASTRAGAAEKARDVAQLLATTASLVGPSRAVRPALEAVGAAALEDAAPLLQPAGLSREGRRLVAPGAREQRERLGALRAEVAARLGVAEPELAQLRRFSPRDLALAVGTLVAITGLLGQVSDADELVADVRAVHGWPAALALLVATGSTLGYAVALVGSVPRRMPLWPAVKLQACAPFANLALPIGAQALQVRFLQRQGVSLASALAAAGVVCTGLGIGLQVVVVVVAAALSPQSLQLDLLPRGALPTLLVVVVAALLLGSGVLAVAGQLRTRVTRGLSRAGTTVWAVLVSPRLLALQVGGNVLVALSLAACLSACLAAFGQHLPLSTLAAIDGAVTTAAMAVPLPGGGTAVGSVGLSGALVAAGVPAAPAVGAVLLYQLATAYLPAVPGWFVLRRLLAAHEV